MLKRVISGGQTGVDRAGLRAAKDLGIETGGWAPMLFQTERGPRPVTLGKIFGLQELRLASYPARTAMNITHSDMTIILDEKESRGSLLTREICLKKAKACFYMTFKDLGEKEEILKWVKSRKHDVINVAGNRESVSPGIEKIARIFFRGLFENLI